MAFPHLSQKQLRHLCNYFGDTPRSDRWSDTISIHCTVNFKVMFAAYSNGNESICFESRWECEDRGNMRLWRCRVEKCYNVYAKSSDAVSHNVISVMLQIRAPDLAAQHQRLLTPSKAESNRLTDSHIFTGAYCICAAHTASVPSSQETY